MESHSLQSASTYLNNLLLARGLLQNGTAIDFAQPNRHGDGTDATMSRIINLVHDLVLRRDRDAEHRETLAGHIRAMRVEQTQRVLDLQKVQDKNAELTRDLTATEAKVRSLNAAARKAEVQAKELKEQMLKMKSTLDQVRAKCLSDVRKRDVELEKLKGHLASMQRGKRETAGMKINVINTIHPHTGFSVKEQRSGGDVNSEDWGLEKETNDFLAALVNETSAENVALRRIVTDTMDTLKDLTGLEQELYSAEDDEEGAIGVAPGPPQYHNPGREAVKAHPDTPLTSVETLVAQMGLILEHCRSILKDPSFVPIEEVQVREDEIITLREGWEKMANRWKEAVTMMDSWRRRMIDGGNAAEVEELSALDFGRSVAVLPNGQPVLGEDHELSSVLFDTDKIDHRLKATGKNPRQDEADEDGEESDLDIPPEPSPKRLAASPARRGMRLPRPPEPLQAISGNVDRSLHSLEPDSFSALTQSADSGIGGLESAVDVENDTFQYKPRSRIPRLVSFPDGVCGHGAALMSSEPHRERAKIERE